MSVVEVKNLTKVFGSGHTAVKAVDSISLKIEAGDIVLIMGPSGSGKTTLISMMGTLLRPTEGQILIDDEDTVTLSDTKLADLRLHKLGFMFQSFNLLSALTAEQNVVVPLVVAGVNKKQSKTKARKLLEQLHLEKRLNNLPKNPCFLGSAGGRCLISWRLTKGGALKYSSLDKVSGELGRTVKSAASFKGTTEGAGMTGKAATSAWGK